jgi:hypothetical protein
MENLILGFPNRADAGTYSAGSWLPALPAANLGTREQWQVARSTDATVASTRFQVDLGRVTNLRAFALANHNMSRDATWRVQLGTAPGATDVYDSGNQPAWALAFDSDMLEWESASFWEGAIDDPTDYQGYPYLAVHALPSWVNARYLTISIDDTANPAGYVQIGRLFAGGGFQPKYDADYGLQDSWVDGTVITETDSGHALADVKRRRRAVSFVLGVVTQTDADVIHEIQRRQGIWGEVLYLPDPSDQVLCQRYGMLGRLAELSPIDYPYYNLRSAAFSIKEL